jgi:hypothetical protein
MGQTTTEAYIKKSTKHIKFVITSILIACHNCCWIHGESFPKSAMARGSSRDVVHDKLNHLRLPGALFDSVKNADETSVPATGVAMAPWRQFSPVERHPSWRIGRRRWRRQNRRRIGGCGATKRAEARWKSRIMMATDGMELVFDLGSSKMHNLQDLCGEGAHLSGHELFLGSKSESLHVRRTATHWTICLPSAYHIVFTILFTLFRGLMSKVNMWL